MKHFTIFATVPQGTGDYGSESKCVFDDKTTQREAEQMAQSIANLLRTKVHLFKGKSIGSLVATYGETT